MYTHGAGLMLRDNLQSTPAAVVTIDGEARRPAASQASGVTPSAALFPGRRRAPAVPTGGL